MEKSMLARRLAMILPAITLPEALDTPASTAPPAAPVAAPPS
jgi:predicted ATPase with chaperone activity